MMEKYKNIVKRAIEKNMTLIAEQHYCEVIKDPLILEVYPYRFDGDFLVCYDVKAGQPHAIDMKSVTKIFPYRKKDDSVPKDCI
ncbi:MAG: hypothetical protein KKD38_06985 [Candidatus Delongbacteria bacterium]|nr:hypothetical protein [Candidatus Delongbacteria bacterium]MCG2759688.1 hypothetical protein [Candidatus Delongbacteria bacterium]